MKSSDWKLEPELALSPPRAVVVPNSEILGTITFLFLGSLPSSLFLILALSIAPRGFPFILDMQKGVPARLMTIVAISIFFALLLIIWEPRWMSRPLVRTGTATCGTVVSREYAGSSEEGEYDCYRCIVAYTAGPATLYLTVEDVEYLSCGRRFSVGDSLTIVYCPENPSRAILYALSPVRAVKPRFGLSGNLSPNAKSLEQ